MTAVDPASIPDLGGAGIDLTDIHDVVLEQLTSNATTSGA